jgi:benzoyl-CoA reductase/2-hydroxyglutaryl-CoA dehydratase subunit BcrC/BadD/HgdB
MKIDISKTISNAVFSRAGNNGEGLARVESLFRAYKLAARINNLNLKIPASDRFYIKIAVDYYAQVLRAHRKHDFIVAYSLGCPVEIFYAMGLTPLQLEATGWVLSMLSGETGKLLTAAGEVGLATEICSVHRLMAGSFAKKLLPGPGAVIWTNMPCENSAKSGAILAHLNSCPGYFLDHPYMHTPEQEQYLVSEYRDLISFLEEKSGRKLSYQKLTEAVAQSNKQLEICREISELRKNVPSPFPSFTFLRLFMTHLLFGGRTEGTAYLERLRNELVSRLRKGKAILPQERFRLINLNLPPLYFLGSLGKLFQEYGAVDVVNPFFLEWQKGNLDPSHPLESLAKKAFMSPLLRICGTVADQELDALKQIVSDYKIDGAINYAHIGCGSFGGVSRLVRDTLRDAGVPVLELACDITDPTVVSPDEMREQFVRFFEQLEDR